MAKIENGINGGTDIPQELAVSSVGAIVWPPVEASENRKKGIFHGVIEHPAGLRMLLEEFAFFPFDERTSRYSARFFIAQQAIRQLTTQDRLLFGQYVEGIVPLEQTAAPGLGDCCMVYIGKNSDDRRSSDEKICQELQQAREIFNSYPIGITNDVHNFRFEILSDLRKRDPEIKDQFYHLYAAFGYVPDEVDEILMSPNNVIAAAFDSDILVSSGLGERAELFINRVDKKLKFVMCEVTEAATRENYRSRGLYTYVAFALMRSIAQTDAHLVYAESNLEAPGVLKAAKRQGRHSVLETFDLYGLIPRPLMQHVRISAGQNDTRPPHLKNDLLVTYLPRMELIQMYGQ